MANILFVAFAMTKGLSDIKHKDSVLLALVPIYIWEMVTYAWMEPRNLKKHKCILLLALFMEVYCFWKITVQSLSTVFHRSLVASSRTTIHDANTAHKLSDFWSYIFSSYSSILVPNMVRIIWSITTIIPQNIFLRLKNTILTKTPQILLLKSLISRISRTITYSLVTSNRLASIYVTHSKTYIQL